MKSVILLSTCIFNSVNSWIKLDSPRFIFVVNSWIKSDSPSKIYFCSDICIWYFMFLIDALNKIWFLLSAYLASQIAETSIIIDIPGCGMIRPRIYLDQVYDRRRPRFSLLIIIRPRDFVFQLVQELRHNRNKT